MRGRSKLSTQLIDRSKEKSLHKLNTSKERDDNQIITSRNKTIYNESNKIVATLFD